MKNHDLLALSIEGILKPILLRYETSFKYINPFYENNMSFFSAFASVAPVIAVVGFRLYMISKS